MTRVLITGGAGFIGLHLAKLFVSRNWQVDLLDNFSRGVWDPELTSFETNIKVRVLNLDLLNPDTYFQLTEDYEYIFHFAAIIGVQNVLAQPFNVLKDNNTMLIYMLEFAKKCPVLKRFIFSSTSEVYAGTLQNFELTLPTPENSPLALTAIDHPRTSYMLSKLYGEALCHASNVPFTIIRPHNFYGPRMGLSHVIPELLKKSHESKNGKIEVFSLEHKRTFCFIEDAIQMILLATESEKCRHQTLNIGTQSPEVSIRELAKKVLGIVGKDLKVIPKHVTIGSPQRRCPDMTLTKQLTGYESQISLEEGISRTYLWYKENIFTAGRSISAK